MRVSFGKSVESSSPSGLSKHYLTESHGTVLRGQKSGELGSKHSLEANLRHAPGSRPLNKPICRVCGKAASVKYNPLVACSTCHRQYHDSCRKPALVVSSDTQRWRCLHCLNDGTRSRLTVRRTLSTIRLKTPANPVPHMLPLNGSDVANRSTSPRVNSKSTSEDRGGSSPKSKAHIHDSQCRTSNVREGLVAPSPVDGVRTSRDPYPLPDHTSIRSKLSLELVRHDDAEVAATEAVSTEVGCNEVNTGCSESSNTRDLLDSRIVDKFEIPNTPTRRSSLIEGDIAKSHMQEHTSLDIDIPAVNSCDHDAPQVDEATVNPRVIHVLCVGCRKQHVLSKSPETATCRSCQKRVRIAHGESLVIPETPDDSPPKDEIAASASPSRKSRARASTHQVAAQNNPAPWFGTNLVACQPVIIKKKVGPEDSEQKIQNHAAAVAPTASSSRATDSSNMCHNVGRQHQNSVASSAAFIDHASISPCKQSLPLVESHRALSEQDVPIGHQNSMLVAGGSYESELANNNTLIATPSSQDAVSDGSVAQRHRGESIEKQGLGSHLMRPLLPGTASKEYQSSKNVPNGTDAILGTRQYTVRQMAAIALVAANGSRLTTSEIITWLAQNLPHLCVGEGSWGRSVRQALSTFTDFYGEKIAGARTNKKRYGFASAEVQARYEKEYPAFRKQASFSTSSEPRLECAALDNVASQPLATHSGSSSEIRVAARRSASSACSTTPMSYRPEDFGTTTRAVVFLKGSEEQETGNDYMSRPFQRSQPRQPLKTLDIDFVIERKTNFHAALARIQQFDSMKMSETERAQKIAEIKARPSRKKYFGSDHRLAHKRRYNLEDIHDERNGAWRPHHFTKNQNLGILDMETRTLEQVFSLPDIVIPMNDGQTELAFRDGTLVNGRLPRPRNIYRVGKMVGGELTIRTN
ncbi:hypothetical protein FB567DRAFT_3271 [Paraphoma chrysanthemicola]|uniref:PHD-type domain-containing protein n=1 Tax=Paraphoma chrysanthemicola TaxID=798071 RepID=A0A8K0W3B3_9PLEO|nr:hypothetical protein FB567DRAFT_3271 [Paraphoma chrysanthemicola]